VWRNCSTPVPRPGRSTWPGGSAATPPPGTRWPTVAELTLAKTVIRDRFTGTATLSASQAADLGCLGYVARASGLHTDARTDHPTVALPVTPITATTGDVLVRYILRRDEFAASTTLATHLIATAGKLDCTSENDEQPNDHTPIRSGVGIAEGWRDTIVHRIELDQTDHITRAKIVDPSWFNCPHYPSPSPTPSSPTFPLPTKASTSPTPATTCRWCAVATPKYPRRSGTTSV
jgi:Ni,Fe-hydrogenase III large subunit